MPSRIVRDKPGLVAATPPAAPMPDWKRRTLLRQAALAAGALVVSPYLAACGGPKAGNAVPTKGSASPVVITYGNWEVYKTQADMHKKNVAAFNASQKTVRVEYQGIANQKMAVELATGDAPNIVNWYSVDPFGPEGVLLPLDEYIKTDTTLLATIVNKQALQQYVVAGKTYAFPSAIYCQMGVYCNEDMFKAAGVGLPKSGPFTLDQFRTAITKLLAYTKTKKNTWPIAPFFPSEYLAVTEGAPLTFSPGGHHYNVANPTLAASYTWQYDLQFKQGASPSAAAVSSLGGTGGNVTMFQTGNIGMMMVDPYPLAPLQAHKTPFHWRVVPGIKEKEYPVHVGIYPLSITKTCKDPQAAYKYLHYIATDKAANHLKLATGYGIPDRKDVAETATGGLGQFVYLLAHATKSYTAPPPLNSINQFSTKVTTPEWQAVATGKATVAQAIAHTVAEWNKHASYHTPS